MDFVLYFSAHRWQCKCELTAFVCNCLRCAAKTMAKPRGWQSDDKNWKENNMVLARNQTYKGFYKAGMLGHDIWIWFCVVTSAFDRPDKVYGSVVFSMQTHLLEKINKKSSKYIQFWKWSTLELLTCLKCWIRKAVVGADYFHEYFKMPQLHPLKVSPVGVYFWSTFSERLPVPTLQ